MAEEIAVVLRRKSENSGLGFSLLGSAGLPPIIYDILENSPAAESGKVKAGDVILKVNETDVNRFSTKEVLRCLRLSEDPIRLILKRDPAIQEKVVHLLSGPHDMCEENLNVVEPSDIVKEVSLKTDDEFIEKENQINFKKPKTPRCEAFMMTGDVILNLSRAQQTTGILPKRQKKIDSLSFRYRHRKRHSSVPTSPNESNLGLRKRSLSSPTESPMVSDKVKSSATASCYSFQTGVRTSKSEDHLQCQKNSSISTVDIDIEDNIASSLNTLLDTRLDGNGIVADQSKSSDSLDMSSNTTVLRITEDHPYTVKNSKNLEERRGKNSDGEKRLSGHDIQKKGEHRRKGQFEKSVSAEKYENETSKVLDKGSPKTDRIVWTYNSNDTSSHSNSGSVSGSEHNLCFGNASTFSSSSSPQRSLSPASPTSVSSSIMSSNSNSLKKFEHTEAEPKPMASHHPGVDQWNLNATSDVSASEAVSNISSPDYQEEITMDILNARDLVMEISDCSDSDSTLLVSDPLTGAQSRTTSERNGVNSVKSKSRMNEKNNCNVVDAEDHKIVIQVKGPDADIEEQNSEESKEKFLPSQSGSDEDSDTESFHSFHYSQKAVDLPSAIRLANRLYYLDGFKKSDVSRHLSKNNDFSRTVAEEYLKHFTFTKDTLDTALRKFLKQFSLTGETQERERVLVHFSKRYLECNPGSFNSQDAVHTLTCALMLLNTDLHGQNISRKMTCEEFIDNLRDLNEGENFPRDILKALYHAIKNYPLEWALDDEADQVACHLSSNDKGDLSSYYGNPFLGIPNLETAVEHKKGYVMRKCCIDPNGKRTPFGKRGWKMFYCTLRDIVLYLHKDEHGFIKTQLSDNLHNAIRIHHSLATKATDYTKKEHVFRLQTADQAEYLFQTSDAKELQSWVDTINFVCASYSSPPLEGAVGSENKFQRPLLPSTQTKLSLREQLVDHEERVQELELSLERHRSDPPYRSAKSALIQNYKDKEAYLQYEIKRYKAYVHILRLKLPQCSILSSPGGMEDDGELGGIVPPPVPDRRIFPSNRYNYRDVVYNSGRGDTSGPDLG